jgi:YidC/Oxa1 family membrane protein insertase
VVATLAAPGALQEKEMEQTRLLLAILLTFLVFVGWEFLFSTRPPSAPTPQDQAQPSDGSAEQIEPETPQAETAPPPSVAPPTPKALPGRPPHQGRQIDVETPLYKIVLSENQGLFKELILKNYKASVASDADLKSLIKRDAINNNMRFGFKGHSVPGIEDAVFTVQSGQDQVTVRDKPEKINLAWTSSSGVEMVKSFIFYPDTYLIDLEVRVANRGSAPLKDRPTLSVSRTRMENQSRVVFEGPSGLIDANLKEIAVSDIEDNPDTAGLVEWVGIVNRYFMAVLIPATAVQGHMQVSLSGDQTITNALVGAEVDIPPGQSHTFTFKAFYGPKSANLLKSYGYNLSKAINFGWFDFLAKPALWIMNQIYSVIPNYGVAIILLTMMTKVILWPLGNKSYKSMNEMKRMQPLMAEIREKYKDDKKKMNEEMMGLYRTYKINPMGGCLPMLVQLPVFLALYNMLYGAIELRHAPFVGWINDLSAPDRLFNFGFSIPFMEPPYGIPVLTVIMGATMFFQQKMSPPPGDPAQAKIMLFLPLVFTFIFINFPAGLVLYWLINNVLSIAQQFYIQKKYA